MPAAAGWGALHVPLTPQNLNPRDRQRKRRRGRGKKRRKRQETEITRVKVKTGGQSKVARTAVWKRGRWRFETWAWGLTLMRLSSLSFVWAHASLQEQIMIWHWRRCWKMAHCHGARSATTLAAGLTGTSQFPSWTPRPRGGPSSHYQLPAACVWAEEINEGEGDNGFTSPKKRGVKRLMVQFAGIMR